MPFALSLTHNFLPTFCRGLHQAAVIVRNHQTVTCEWLRRVVPPQAALQTETKKFKRWPVWSARPLQDRCIRRALSSQPHRRLQLYRALLHSDTLGSGTEQRHGLPLPWPRRYAPLLFPRTRQRQERVPGRLQPVHWSGEYWLSTIHYLHFDFYFEALIKRRWYAFFHFNKFNPRRSPPPKAHSLSRVFKSATRASVTGPMAVCALVPAGWWDGMEESRKLGWFLWLGVGLMWQQACSSANTPKAWSGRGGFPHKTRSVKPENYGRVIFGVILVCLL